MQQGAVSFMRRYGIAVGSRPLEALVRPQVLLRMLAHVRFDQLVKAARVGDRHRRRENCRTADGCAPRSRGCRRGASGKYGSTGRAGDLRQPRGRDVRRGRLAEERHDLAVLLGVALVRRIPDRQVALQVLQQVADLLAGDRPARCAGCGCGATARRSARLLGVRYMTLVGPSSVSARAPISSVVKCALSISAPRPCARAARRCSTPSKWISRRRRCVARPPDQAGLEQRAAERLEVVPDQVVALAVRSGPAGTARC